MVEVGAAAYPKLLKAAEAHHKARWPQPRPCPMDLILSSRAPDIDWLLDVHLKPLPGKTAPEILKAIDKMIVIGSKVGGNLLKAAPKTHQSVALMLRV